VKKQTKNSRWPLTCQQVTEFTRLVLGLEGLARVSSILSFTQNR